METGAYYVGSAGDLYDRLYAHVINYSSNLLKARYYSSCNNTPDNPKTPEDSQDPLKPVKVYNNADTMKQQILKENKVSGIYMWKNNANGKCYVGSAVDLSKRLYNYYNIAFLENQLSHPLGEVPFRD